MADPRTVLAVGAHPDDVELLCAGTLALLREQGWRVVIATMTPGDKGSAELPADEIARIRRQEAGRAAAILDADYHCLEWRDLAVFLGDTASRRATALLRAVRPDLVLTHSPVDYLTDHEETSRIVRHACFAAPVHNYLVPGFAARPTGAATQRPSLDIPPPSDAIPHLYFFDPVDGRDGFGRPVEASLVVDIGDAIETKARMLAEHESQREWLRAQHGVDDYVDRMREWARRRGEEVGCEYGEGFRQYVGHAYPQSDLLGEVLGDRVHRTGELAAPAS